MSLKKYTILMIFRGTVRKELRNTVDRFIMVEKDCAMMLRPKEKG